MFYFLQSDKVGRGSKLTTTALRPQPRPAQLPFLYCTLLWAVRVTHKRDRWTLAKGTLKGKR